MLHLLYKYYELPAKNDSLSIDVNSVTLLPLIANLKEHAKASEGSRVSNISQKSTIQ